MTIARPPAGIADVAIVSTSRRGPAATSVRGTFRQLWVRFHLAVRPAAGRPLTVTWFAPGARRGKVVGRPNQAAIESFVRSASPLAKGRWRVVLRAGPTIVRQLVIRID